MKPLTRNSKILIFAIIIGLIIAFLGLYGTPVQAQYISKGDPMYLSKPKDQTTSTPSTGPTKTTGYIDGKYVNLKTVATPDGGTRTTGYVDGEYVNVKTKKKP